MIAVFSPLISLSSNQRPAKCSILTPRCAVWLCGVMHTESNSAEWCTLRSLTTRSFLKVWMSRRNRKRIRKCFCLLSEAQMEPIMQKIEVKNKKSLHTILFASILTDTGFERVASAWLACLPISHHISTSCTNLFPLRYQRYVWVSDATIACCLSKPLSSNGRPSYMYNTVHI